MMGEERELDILLEGFGKDKEEAFLNALGGLQKKVVSQTGGLILRIEPLSVEFIEGVELRRTEKFLFLFMKREISVYSIKVKVNVRVFLVRLENCAFRVEQEKRKFFQ